MNQSTFSNQLTAIGKRLVMVLTMLLIVGIGQVWGAEVFKETFKNSTGTAGFSGNAGAGTFVADNTGWTNQNPYGAGGAAKFGTGKKIGEAETPSINCGIGVTSATLTFKSGAWSGDAKTLKLSYTNCSGAATVTLKDAQWSEYTVELTNITGNIKIKFTGNATSNARFLLDDVVVSTTDAPTTYTVTYNKNGATSGSVPTDAASYTSGATVTVKSNSGNLAKTGYTFGGWNTKADGTGINYNAGSGTFTIADNTTLYAKWTVNTHTLTWNVNGGNDLTGTYTQGTVAYGTTITKPSDPTRTGHTFKGWSIDGTNIVTPASTMPDNDLTYIALWTPLTQYTVKWIVNGNEYTEGTPTASVYEGAKWSSLTLPTAPNPNDYCGQVFAGWTTTNIGSTGLDKDNDATAIQNLNLMTSENKSSKTNTITDNITFYAVFADYANQ